MLTRVGMRDRLRQIGEATALPQVVCERAKQAGSGPEHEVDRRAGDLGETRDLVEAQWLCRGFSEALGHGIEDATTGLLGSLGSEALLVLPRCHGSASSRIFT